MILPHDVCFRARATSCAAPRWTPWMPCGSWLWPVKPAASHPPALPRFQRPSCTTRPTPRPAGAAATDASDGAQKPLLLGSRGCDEEQSLTVCEEGVPPDGLVLCSHAGCQTSAQTSAVLLNLTCLWKRQRYFNQTPPPALLWGSNTPLTRPVQVWEVSVPADAAGRSGSCSWFRGLINKYSEPENQKQDLRRKSFHF